MVGRFRGLENFPSTLFQLVWTSALIPGFPLKFPFELADITAQNFPGFLTPFGNLGWAKGFGWPKVSGNLGEFPPGKLSFKYILVGNLRLSPFHLFPGLGKAFGTFFVGVDTARNLARPFPLNFPFWGHFWEA